MRGSIKGALLLQDIKVPGHRWKFTQSVNLVCHVLFLNKRPDLSDTLCVMRHMYEDLPGEIAVCYFV